MTSYPPYDGEEALLKIRTNLPDVVLLDINMPRMDGYEVCAQLKADPATADIPVLMLTALAEPEQRVKGLQLGAEDYVAKPFDHRELVARVWSQASHQAGGRRAAGGAAGHPPVPSSGTSRPASSSGCWPILLRCVWVACSSR